MTIKELDQRIAGLEPEVASGKKAMTDTARQIVDALKLLVPEAVDPFIVKCVRDAPEVAEKLSNEQLAQMKVKVKALKDALPELIETEYAKGSWPHQSGHAWQQPSHRRPQDGELDIPGYISQTISIPTSGFTKIFTEFGFHRSAMGIFATDDVKWPPPTLAAIRQYNEMMSEWDRKRSKLSDLRYQRTKASAEDRWNKA